MQVPSSEIENSRNDCGPCVLIQRGIMVCCPTVYYLSVSDKSYQLLSREPEPAPRAGYLLPRLGKAGRIAISRRSEKGFFEASDVSRDDLFAPSARCAAHLKGEKTRFDSVSPIVPLVVERGSGDSGPGIGRAIFLLSCPQVGSPELFKELSLAGFQSNSTGTPCLSAASRIILMSRARRSISSPKSAPSSS